MNRAIGIDLGTTFSAAAIVVDQQRAIAIPNREGTTTTPSVALWHEGRFLVGQPALDLAYNAQGAERERLESSLIRGVKRMIGKPPQGGLVSNGYCTDPIEVSSAILSKLANDASAYLGFPVQDIVITVPAHFVDHERNATKIAAERAGLHVLQIINEPSAAALTYTQGQATKPGTALVFDLGGGTFDVTILEFEADNARVIATRGIEELGGINFTTELTRILQRLYEQETQAAFPEDSASNALLFTVAENAKCRLSDAMTTNAYLAPRSGKATKLTITRQQFERQIKLLLLELEMAVEDVLEGKKPDAIQRVLLCGGSSRIPAVQAMLTNIFSYPPEAILDLDLSVALGAAYQAAAYKTNPESHTPGLQLMPNDEHVIDCVSYAVGIAVKDARDADSKLIMLQPGDPLNTWSSPHPVLIRTNAATFPPIRLYTGNTEQLHESEYLTSITVTLPQEARPGTRASIKMRQDHNGLIQVEISIEGRNISSGLQRI